VIGQATGHRHRGVVERWTASADPAQGPAHTLLDEVPLVASGSLDQWQAPGERLVAGLLVMPGETRQQREGRALDELIVLVAPLRDLGPGVRRAVEEVKAQRVTEGPAVEVATPSDPSARA
jgi:hypothetical protein